MWRSAFVFLSVTLLVFLHEYPAFLTESFSDFRSFYWAAMAVRRHIDPYDVNALDALGGGAHVWPYLYSPLLAVLSVPLTMLGEGAAFRLWSFASIVCVGLTAALVTSEAGKRTTSFQAIVLGTLCTFALGIAHVLRFGQVNTIVLLPLTIGIAWRDRHPHAAGVGLAVAALLKSSPLLLVLVFACERRWRLVATALVSAAALAALTLPVVGVAVWEHFVVVARACSRFDLVPGLFGFQAPWNFSIGGVLLRQDVNARFWAPLLSGALTVPVLVAAWRGRRSFVLPALVVMVLSSPLAWTHHVIYVLPGVLAALLGSLAQRRALYGAAVLACATAAAVDFPLRDLGSINTSALLALYLLGFFA